ncbi:serine/threonine-protein kinase [Spirillospora sp. NPDC047279]|uniref:serine/threonine-protein kinase n=1 Tax=Spirillospora sp. NPDC047279 TaxID=3155478 RepID=UPI00340FB45C
MSGERVLAGRYRLVQRLGQGAMGVVWRARDEALGRDVAVKELLLPTGLAPEARATAAQRAMREARAAALLRHPSIVTVHDVVQDGGRPCIVMDLLPGRSLDDVLEQDGPLPPERAAEIGLDVLAALRAAHERGVLHRDVKPANIFLRDDGRAVLTDFGIATLAGDATLTATGALIGSPAYMAPERVGHTGGGPGSDLWSLGVTLYVLAEGRAPFSRGTLMGTLSAVLTEPPEPPRRSGALGPVLMALMTKDPAARLDDQAARRWLSAVAAGRPAPQAPAVPLPSGPPPVAHPPGHTTRSPAERPTEPGLRPPGRRRWPLAAAASAVAVLAAAVVLAIVLTSNDGNGGGKSPSTAGGGSPSTPAAAGSTAAPAAPATIPPVCTMLTPAQAERLVPGFRVTPSASTDPSTRRPGKRCGWEPAAGSGDDGGKLEVTVEGEAPGAAGSTRTRFAEIRDTYAPRNASPDPGRPFTDVSGLADAAFAVVELSTTPQATVYFRSGGLLVTVEYARPSLTPAQVREQAVSTARLIETALKRSS